jgi:plasmid stabilization system protein ParE
MTFKVEFRKEALEDLLNTIAWYEKQVPGLGDEFYLAFSNEIRIFRHNPLIYAPKYREIRKAITKRFPYIIYFIVKPPEIVIIIAVLHMKRGSITFKKRMNKL